MLNRLDGLCRQWTPRPPSHILKQSAWGQKTEMSSEQIIQQASSQATSQGRLWGLAGLLMSTIQLVVLPGWWGIESGHLCLSSFSLQWHRSVNTRCLLERKRGRTVFVNSGIRRQSNHWPTELLQASILIGQEGSISQSPEWVFILKRTWARDGAAEEDS